MAQVSFIEIVAETTTADETTCDSALKELRWVCEFVGIRIACNRQAVRLPVHVSVDRSTSTDSVGSKDDYRLHEQSSLTVVAWGNYGRLRRPLPGRPLPPESRSRRRE
jgi:hypothetical protein